MRPPRAGRALSSATSRRRRRRSSGGWATATAPSRCRKPTPLAAADACDGANAAAGRAVEDSRVGTPRSRRAATASGGDCALSVNGPDLFSCGLDKVVVGRDGVCAAVLDSRAGRASAPRGVLRHALRGRRCRAAASWTRCHTTPPPPSSHARGSRGRTACRSSRRRSLPSAHSRRRRITTTRMRPSAQRGARAARRAPSRVLRTRAHANLPHVRRRRWWRAPTPARRSRRRPLRQCSSRRLYSATSSTPTRAWRRWEGLHLVRRRAAAAPAPPSDALAALAAARRRWHRPRRAVRRRGGARGGGRLEVRRAPRDRWRRVDVLAERRRGRCRPHGRPWLAAARAGAILRVGGAPGARDAHPSLDDADTARRRVGATREGAADDARAGRRRQRRLRRRDGALPASTWRTPPLRVSPRGVEPLASQSRTIDSGQTSLSGESSTCGPSAPTAGRCSTDARDLHEEGAIGGAGCHWCTDFESFRRLSIRPRRRQTPSTAPRSSPGGTSLFPRGTG